MKVEWWPPKVGDKLRHLTRHGDDRALVEALLHVLSVFEHDGRTLIVAAEWFPTKRRWHYECWHIEAARVGLIWPDGQPRPPR